MKEKYKHAIEMKFVNNNYGCFIQEGKADRHERQSDQLGRESTAISGPKVSYYHHTAVTKWSVTESDDDVAFPLSLLCQACVSTGLHFCHFHRYFIYSTAKCFHGYNYQLH